MILWHLIYYYCYYLGYGQHSEIHRLIKLDSHTSVSAYLSYLQHDTGRMDRLLTVAPPTGILHLYMHSYD